MIVLLFVHAERLIFWVPLNIHQTVALLQLPANRLQKVCKTDLFIAASYKAALCAKPVSSALIIPQIRPVVLGYLVFLFVQKTLNVIVKIIQNSHL